MIHSKIALFTIISVCLFMSCSDSTHTIPTYTSVDEYPVYEKDDLGLSYSKAASTFKVWSPAAQAVKLRIYTEGLGGDPIQVINMQRSEQGTWAATVNKDLNYKYYTYQVQQNDTWLNESPDPYAVACGANGQRAMVVDWADTDPIDWQKDKRPPLEKPNDIVVYELHIRDMSISEDSGIRHKGTFLGLAEPNTQTETGTKTGLAHLQELGVTHVHILPAFDFKTIDETLPPEKRPYNWGYDPHLYNVPEGTYATNPQEGQVRVQELKQLIQQLHEAGIRVVLDVVYNHTGVTESSVFNQICPDYYYRKRPDGTFSDASACGNEIASERPMVRRFITNSVRHWAENYHIDGFRFDLMGIHDIATMNAVRATLDAIDPSIFIYGEGWLAGDSPLPESERAIKANVPKMNGIAAFSDEIRDGIKGHIFTKDARGFISGLEGQKPSVQFGIVGGTDHPQIDFTNINYTDKAWAPSPAQCMVYASCHDNHTIWDRLINSIPDASEEARTQMQQLALAIVLTSQGVPFLHAGSEFCRTKQGEENSYKSPDSINQITWSRKGQYYATFLYVKNLIALRKAHPAFRMPTAEMIAQYLRFLDTPDSNVLGFTLNGEATGDSWSQIAVFYNGHGEDKKILLPEGKWTIVAKNDQVNENGLAFDIQGNTVIPRYSMLLLKK